MEAGRYKLSILPLFEEDLNEIVDYIAPLLEKAAFAPLGDKEVFRGVYIDYGVTVWNDGDIDIAPEYLYENSVPAEQTA